jgi:hypothetical protein
MNGRRITRKPDRSAHWWERRPVIAEPQKRKKPAGRSALNRGRPTGSPFGDRLKTRDISVGGDRSDDGRHIIARGE